MRTEAQRISRKKAERERRKRRMVDDPEFKAKIRAKEAERKQRRIVARGGKLRLASRKDLDSQQSSLAKRVTLSNKTSRFYAMKKGLPVDDTGNLEAFNLLESQGRKCAYCAVSLDTLNLVLDKKVPFSSGGGHVIENLHFICKPCHLEKYKMIQTRQRERILIPFPALPGESKEEKRRRYWRIKGRERGPKKNAARRAKRQAEREAAGLPPLPVRIERAPVLRVVETVDFDEAVF